jgi:ParB family chromosome partitioning protein
MEDLEGRLRERLGTRVRIQERGGRGKMVIDFYSREDFDRILEILGA